MSSCKSSYLDLSAYNDLSDLFLIPLAWKAVGGFCDSAFFLCGGVYGCVCVYVPVWLGFHYSGLLWKVEVRLQLNVGQRCSRVPLYVNEVKGHVPGSFIWRIPSYVNEVKGHVPRSRDIWGQVRWKILVSLFGSPLISWSLIGTKLGSKMQ